MNNKLEKVVKLADAMYYAAQNLTTDASRLHKAMEDYHQFIINDYCKEALASEDSEKAARHYLLNVHASPLNAIMHEADLKAEMQYHKDIENAFKAGTQWQKEQMMKGAIDTRIDKRLADMIGYTGSERVKVIIIKE